MSADKKRNEVAKTKLHICGNKSFSKCFYFALSASVINYHCNMCTVVVSLFLANGDSRDRMIYLIS